MRTERSMHPAQLYSAAGYGSYTWAAAEQASSSVKAPVEVAYPVSPPGLLNAASSRKGRSRTRSLQDVNAFQWDDLVDGV